MSDIAIKVLALARMGLGLGLLSVPATVTRLCLLPVVESDSLIYRVAGSRDLALGGLLWFASASGQQASSGSGEVPKDSSVSLRQALIAGVVADSLDFVSTVLCFADGNLASEPAVLFAVGSAAFLGFGLIGLRSSKLVAKGSTQIK